MALLYAKASDGYLASIPVNVMGFTQSLEENGWQKLPSGLIIQWGRLVHATISYEGTRVISFPIVFDVLYLSVVGILTQPVNCDTDAWVNLVQNDSSSATFYVQAHPSNNDPHTGLQWIAMG